MFEWWQQLMKGEQGAGDVADPDDPERLLTEAQRQMRETHQRNRERAVQAITQKNNLQTLVDDYRRRVTQLQEQAARAEAVGRTVDAIRLRDEAMAVGMALRQTENSLRQAVETSDAVKVAIKQEEERVRQKLWEAMHLTWQWRLVQIERVLANSRRHTEQSARDPERFQVHLNEASDARDHLLTSVEDSAQKIASLRVKAEMARKRGDDLLEHELLREMEQAEAMLDQTQEALERANAVIERLESILRGEQVSWVYAEPTPETSAWSGDEEPEKDRAVVVSLALAAVMILALLLLLLLLV